MALSSEKLNISGIITADIVNEGWFSVSGILLANIVEGFYIRATTVANIIPDIRTEYLKSPQAPSIEVTI